jgi:hypothetical protein
MSVLRRCYNAFTFSRRLSLEGETQFFIYSNKIQKNIQYCSIQLIKFFFLCWHDPRPFKKTHMNH